jgi:hypothetical protein
MATTFLKRQKEMKRLEKQREKAERRAQKKLTRRTQNEPSAENISSGDNEAASTSIAVPSESGPHN